MKYRKIQALALSLLISINTLSIPAWAGNEEQAATVATETAVTAEPSEQEEICENSETESEKVPELIPTVDEATSGDIVTTDKNTEHKNTDDKITDEEESVSNEDEPLSEEEIQVEETTLDAPTAATTITPNVQKHTKEEIQAFFNSHPAYREDKVFYDEAPTFSEPYYQGKLSALTEQSALNMMNQVRFIAGLNANVELHEGYSYYAQCGSYLNALNDEMTHFPRRPAELADSAYDELDYDGYYGCQHSNLGRCYDTLSVAIIDGWMHDGGSSNIDRVGHRRWILNPYMKYTGFGWTGEYSAMYSTDKSGNGTESYVCWPAQVMPADYFYPSEPWSCSVGSAVKKDTTSVRLTRKSDGRVWNFSSASADGYFNVDDDAYGQRGCIIFRPDNLGTIKAGDSYEVRISLNNGETVVEYPVEFFKLDLSSAQKHLENADAVMSSSVKGYGGSSTTPEIELHMGNETLRNGTDYTVTYKKNASGLVTEAFAEGKGRYVGSKMIKIVPISYELNGGHESFNQNPAATVEELTYFQEPERDGYVFRGWYDNPAFNGSRIDYISLNKYESLTLYAKWEQEINYSIKYNANGGTGGPENYSGFGYPVVNAYRVPSRLFYTFAGWSTSPTAKEAEYLPGDDLPCQNSITLYAVWADPYTVSNDEDQTYENPIMVGDMKQSYKIVPDTDRTYVFETKGEYDTYGELYDAQGNLLNRGDDEGEQWNFMISQALKKGATYYLVIWADSEKCRSLSLSVRRTAAITYDAAGGNGAPAVQSLQQSGSTKLSETIPSKTITINYNANGGKCTPTTVSLMDEFVSWNTSDDGSGTDYAPGAVYTGSSDLKLYAVWKAVTPGTMPVPEKAGYSFDGWYTSANGGTIITEEAELSRNITLYAHWTEARTEITKQPETVRAGIGTTVTYTIEANGSGLTYQWQYSKDGGKKWLKSSSSTSTTDHVSVKVSASNAGSIYRCVVKDGSGRTIISETAGIDLIPGVVINLNPQSQVAAIGEYATFTIDAENAAGYQWQYSKDGAHWYNSGAEGNKTDTLIVKGAQNSQGNRYRCVVLGIDGNKKKSYMAAMIVLTQAPKTCTAKVGETASYSLKAEGIESYQWQYSKDNGASWYKSGATGADTDTVSFKATATNRAMIYRCKLTTPDGAAAFTKPVGFAE